MYKKNGAPKRAVIIPIGISVLGISTLAITSHKRVSQGKERKNIFVFTQIKALLYGTIKPTKLIIRKSNTNTYSRVVTSSADSCFLTSKPIDKAVSSLSNKTSSSFVFKSNITIKKTIIGIVTNIFS